MDADAELDGPDGESLATAVPRAVLRAPFMAKELGALRYLAAREGGMVAVFSSGSRSTSTATCARSRRRSRERFRTAR